MQGRQSIFQLNCCGTYISLRRPEKKRGGGQKPPSPQRPALPAPCQSILFPLRLFFFFLVAWFSANANISSSCVKQRCRKATAFLQFPGGVRCEMSATSTAFSFHSRFFFFCRFTPSNMQPSVFMQVTAFVDLRNVSEITSFLAFLSCRVSSHSRILRKFPWKFPIVFFGNFQTNIDYQKPTFLGVFFYPFLSSSEPLVPPHGFGAAWQQ